jgi:hypothetical protein
LACLSVGFLKHEYSLSVIFFMRSKIVSIAHHMALGGPTEFKTLQFRQSQLLIDLLPPKLVPKGVLHFDHVQQDRRSSGSAIEHGEHSSCLSNQLGI